MIPTPQLFTVTPTSEDEPLLAAVERALVTPVSPLDTLPTLTNVALGDPYLAQQLASLHSGWELRPPAPRGLLARVRTRLAWWLLGEPLGARFVLGGALMLAGVGLVVFQPAAKEPQIDADAHR